jgi:hypothetical protein
VIILVRRLGRPGRPGRLGCCEAGQGGLDAVEPAVQFGHVRVSPLAEWDIHRGAETIVGVLGPSELEHRSSLDAPGGGPGNARMNIQFCRV